MNQFKCIITLATEICYGKIRKSYFNLILDNVTHDFRRILIMHIYYKYLKEECFKYKQLKNAVKELF